MLVHAVPNKKTEFIYLLFMVWAVFSVCFMFADLSVITLIRISLFTTPIIVLNIFAVGIYLFIQPGKKIFGIVCALLWAILCGFLFISQFFDDYAGVFGTFVMVLRSWPYEMLMMVAIAISLYLLFMPFKIVSLAVPQAQVTQGLRDFAKNAYFPLLAALSCTVFHAVNNVIFLTPVTTLLFLAGFVGVALFLYCMLSFAGRKVLPYKNIGLITALCILIWMFLPTFVALMRIYAHPLWLRVSFLTVIPVILYYLFRARPRLVVLYMCISLPLSLCSYWLNEPATVDTVGKVKAAASFSLPKLPATPIAANAPNVYILTYDGTPNLEMLDKLGVNAKGLKSTLQDNNFTVYANTYSVAQTSLVSMSATYNMSEPLTGNVPMWQANGGQGAGFGVFRENAYHLESIQHSYMTSTFQDFDINLPAREFRAVEKGDFLYFLFKAIFSGEFRFEDIINAGGDLSPHKKVLFEADRKRRMVVMHNYHPGHSQLSGKCLPNQKEIYEEKLGTAIAMIAEDIERIDRYDPNAIVVFMGDHGPYLTGDCTSLLKNDPYSLSELEIMDRFSTLVAIRWPDAEKGAKYGKDIMINQDIFPAIFAYLYDSEEPLRWKIEPKAYLNGRLVIDQGKFCPVEAKKD